MKGMIGRVGLVFAIWGIIYMALVELDPSSMGMPIYFPLIITVIGTALYITLGGFNDE